LSMAIVRLPASSRKRVERSALRRGVAVSRVLGRPLRLAQGEEVVAPRSFCAGCAAPVEFGAVIRGSESYCSVECSQGGNQPA
jgi:hypothetical protein